MEQYKQITLSDFMDKDIILVGTKQFVVLDYVEDKPVRVLGYSADISKSKYDVREGAYFYFKNLIEQSEMLRKYGK